MAMPLIDPWSKFLATPLRLVVVATGSRDWRTPPERCGVLDWPSRSVVLLHGGAIGADQMMAEYAAKQGWQVLPAFKPDYESYPGRVAPKIRNGQMIAEAVRLGLTYDVPVLCQALWRDHSGGTAHTIGLARQHDLGVSVVYDCDCHGLIGT